MSFTSKPTYSKSEIDAARSVRYAGEPSDSSTFSWNSVTHEVTVSNVTSVYLYTNEDNLGIPSNYSCPNKTFTLTDLSSTYIYADYNGGSPILNATTDISILNRGDRIVLWSFLRDGNDLHYRNWHGMGSGMPERLMEQQFRGVGLERFFGLNLTETAGNTINISNGQVWYATRKFDISTLVSGAIDVTTYLWYETAPGVWTNDPTLTAYNIVKYNDGAGLKDVTGGNYVVNYIYALVDDSGDKEIFITLGNGDYTLTQAKEAPIKSLPATIAPYAIFVGRIIVEKSAASATVIESSFTKFIGTAPATDHNNLTGIQGGAIGDYYHFTLAQHGVLVGGAASDADALHTHDDKADLISTPTLNNLVSTDAAGQSKDSGIASSSVVTKIIGGTTNNFVSLTAGGSIQDSGKSNSDYQPKVSTPTTNGIVTLSASGYVQDSTKTLNDLISKVPAATNGHIATFSSGGIIDSGVVAADVQTKVVGSVVGHVATFDSSGFIVNGTVPISTLAEKVAGAVNGDLASLDATGNLVDSGIKVSDTQISTVPASAGNFAALDAAGKLIDSTRKHADYQIKIVAPVVDNLVKVNSSGQVEDSGITTNKVVEKVSGAVLNNFASLTSSGSIQDSGKSNSDYQPKVSTPTTDGIVTLNASGYVQDSTKTLNDLIPTVPTAVNTNIATFSSGKVADSGVKTTDLISKVTGAAAGNIATFVSGGSLSDSSVAVATLASKVSSPTNGHLASVDGSGNLLDSGIAKTDVQITTVPAASGNLAALTGAGKLEDAGVKNSDLVHISGTETITGDKTLSGSTTINTLLINGIWRMPVSALTLASGANNNVNIGTGSFLRITGPTANFNITGIAGGVDGRRIILYNTTADNMSVINESASSTAANRIITLNNSNTTNGPGIFQLIYDGIASRWILFGVNL